MPLAQPSETLAEPEGLTEPVESTPAPDSLPLVEPFAEMAEAVEPVEPVEAIELDLPAFDPGQEIAPAADEQPALAVDTQEVPFDTAFLDLESPPEPAASVPDAGQMFADIDFGSLAAFSSKDATPAEGTEPLAEPDVLEAAVDGPAVQNAEPEEAAPEAPAEAAATAQADPPPGSIRPVIDGAPALASLINNEAVAWRELAPLWGQALNTGEACATALEHQLQCYRTDRMTLNGLRQLNRPGILVLRADGQGAGRALVTAMTSDSVTLQAGEQQWRLPLTALANLWRGEFATLWRTPPGHSGRLVDGLEGPAALWLGERIASLQAQGRVPPSASDLDARVKAFQRSQGVEAAGVAGPVTFMQVNLASGVDEPRLHALKP